MNSMSTPLLRYRLLSPSMQDYFIFFPLPYAFYLSHSFCYSPSRNCFARLLVFSGRMYLPASLLLEFLISLRMEYWNMLWGICQTNTLILPQIKPSIISVIWSCTTLALFYSILLLAFRFIPLKTRFYSILFSSLLFSFRIELLYPSSGETVPIYRRGKRTSSLGWSIRTGCIEKRWNWNRFPLR